ncbi:PDZ domain-containing protein [Luteolibacter sp. Populi]|uniref:PDZ domain-containing protein n=1 Tax=Luteolibacter sp. Populi TaxID=3230487 RepID=UPI003467E60A
MLPRSTGHLALLAILAGSATAAAGDLDALVGNLASDDFKTREAGSAGLVQRAKSDIAAVRDLCLRHYLKSPDPEIRIRCKEILRDLMLDSYGFLGVHHRSMTYPGKDGKPKRAVEIMTAVEGQPAHAAGLRPGDIITEFNGHPLDVPDPTDEFGRRIRLCGAGRKVTIKFRRAGKPMALQVTTGAAPRELLHVDSEVRFQEWLKAQAEFKEAP